MPNKFLSQQFPIVLVNLNMYVEVVVWTVFLINLEMELQYILVDL